MDFLEVFELVAEAFSIGAVSNEHINVDLDGNLDNGELFNGFRSS